MCKKSSDYDRYLFDQPLEEGAKFFDLDFRGKGYFSKVNLTQQRFLGS
jgi:hypothetical protein